MLSRTILLISLFLTFSSLNIAVHPYYISVTEIRIDPGKRSVSLSCRMFTDDLQNALGKLYNARPDLVKRTGQCDSLINKYVQERVEIMVGNSKVNFSYVGYEMEEEAAWCYFEGQLPSDARSVKVAVSLLYDFLETQTNFIHCYYNADKKSFKLVNPNREAAFIF